MMIQVPTKQAITELDELLDEAAHGQDVVIIGTNGSAFKLVHLPHAPKPIFGSARGLVQIGPDFDEPIDGLEDYMP
jgi:antitoxin (DNA-binding transcriptional repressor) of toxin-antitoxin stability system